MVRNSSFQAASPSLTRRARTWFLPTTSALSPTTPAKKMSLSFLRPLPDRRAVAQVDAVDRVGVGGGEDHLAPRDDGRRRLPFRDRSQGAHHVHSGADEAGLHPRLLRRGLFGRDRLAIGVGPRQAARHQVDAEDLAGVRRADENPLAVRQERRVDPAADGVRHAVALLDHAERLDRLHDQRPLRVAGDLGRIGIDADKAQLRVAGDAEVLFVEDVQLAADRDRCPEEMAVREVLVLRLVVGVAAQVPLELACLDVDRVEAVLHH